MNDLERVKRAVEMAYRDAARSVDISSLKAATLLECQIPEKESNMCRAIIITVDDIKMFCVIIARIEISYVGDQSIFLEVPITINKLSNEHTDVDIYHEVLSQLHNINMAMKLRDVIINSLPGFVLRPT